MTRILSLRNEFGFLIMSLAIGVLLFSSARSIPESIFEPMGPAAFPTAIAMITISLVALKALTLFATNDTSQGAAEDKQNVTSFFKSLSTLLIFTLFVGMVYFLDIALWISTFLFLTVYMLFLKRPKNITNFIVQCMFLAVFSMILDYVAIHVLYLNL